VDLGEELGGIVVNYLPAIPETDLSKKLADLKAWAHGN
jgi:hypothetical protein